MIIMVSWMIIIRERSLIMGGGGGANRGGHEFQCKQIEGGGQNFSASL